MVGRPPELSRSGITSADPSLPVRLVSLLGIVLAGACGGLIGYAVTDLQCGGTCPTLAGIIGLVAAGLTAMGVGLVTVLALRAMAEWQATSRQQAARDHYPVD